MKAIRTLLATAAFASILAGAVDAATVSLVVLDPAGTGFNDPTVVAAVPGNSATTLGQQRLNSFQAAANVWAAKLSSSVVIQVGVQMSALTCTPTSGILGQAGPNTVHRDFSGTPRASTWYSAALANSLAGSDLSAANNDIGATFNSTLDLGTAGCLGGLKWWYGINSPPQGNTVDFFGTVLHEICHGLGFLTFVSQTGQKFNSFDDAFMVNLENHSLGLTWPSMTDSQRAASSVDAGNLHWIGSNVIAKSVGFLSAGANAQGHVRMYAPSPFEPGSSVSHWDTVVTPNELMEPIANSDARDIISTEALQDTGWRLQTGSCTYSLNPTSVSWPAAGSSGVVSVTAGAGCAWSVTSNAAFITASGGGTGNGSFSVSAAANTGAARSGTVTVATQTFTVNQAGTTGGGCTSNDTTLCINARFQVQVGWSTVQGGGQSGQGHAVSASPIGFTSGGIFWFFSSSNPEMLVKVVNGCSISPSRYWVFASAGTNVGLNITVTDTQAGVTKTYSNPDLTAAQPIQDTNAFATCP